MSASSRWSGVGAAYRRSFATLCAGTVDVLLADTFGPDHLDVGCGTGTLACAAAAAGRSVVAVDADPDMVELTRGQAPEAHVEQMSLPELGLPSAAYDAVTANIVINHLPDPRAAVRELARVVRPGGRVAITTWTGRRTAQAVLFSESLTAAGAVPVSGQRLPAEVDFDRSPTGLEALTAAAGLTTVVARELEWVWTVAWDDLWAAVSSGVASIGETYLAQDVATQARIEVEMRERARALEVDGVVRLPSVAAYMVASLAL
ncbi:class I SAM-dependent methyltransferase [uncultured Jatrophihabitans sp.]|uniref:class I SAM-dependent methyltransferase n=1 Tax=uncultured Jatrophihabitans sp. TaxID=1610747 RepID=UPI0035CC6E50